MDRQAWHGVAERGIDRRGYAGEARLVKVEQGVVWQAGRGEA